MNKTDSLKVTQNPDGSYLLEWDPDDPEWKFLNQFSTEEIEIFIQQAIRGELKDD